MKKELNCLRCEYQWTPRGKNKPKACPRCKSYAYERPIPIKPVVEEVVKESIVMVPMSEVDWSED